MFIGHFAAALVARRAAPAVSLGTLFLAAQFIDLLWPTFLLLGIEDVVIAPGNTVVTPLEFVHYPWSHSLLAVLGWGLLLGGTHYALKRSLRAALVIGALVASHWFLDLLAHRPDLPLSAAANSPVFGLGLWYSLSATMVVELSLFAIGIALYLRGTSALDNVGRWAPWALFALLSVIYLGNLFGPPPEKVTDIAIVGHAQWLLVWMAYWVDRHRAAEAVWKPATN